MTSSWSRSVSASARPSRTPFFASIKTFPTTWFPAVSDTMSSDSRMGTPAWINDPRVCDKRASDTLWTSCPKMGGLSLKPSHFSRPLGVLIQRRACSDSSGRPQLLHLHVQRNQALGGVFGGEVEPFTLPGQVVHLGLEANHVVLSQGRLAHGLHVDFLVAVGLLV